MVAKTVALKKIDLLWKVHCTRSWHVLFKAVGISEVVCMCSAAILEISEILCVGCVMEHTRAHTHKFNDAGCIFKKIEKIHLSCMNFCLALPFWRTDGKLAVLITMAGNISTQGKIICHLCAYSSGVAFTFLVNCVLGNELPGVSEYLWKGLWYSITNSIWTAV